MTRDEILNFNGPEQHKKNLINFSYMLDDDCYASILEPGDDATLYYNHSCDPNSWYAKDSNGKEIMVARRDIRPGEEIVCHYGTFESELSFHAGMKCFCGASNCEGVFTGLSYRDPEFLTQYEGRLSPYLTRLSEGLSWYRPHLYLRKSGTGGDPMEAKGVFTSKAIPRGAAVLSWAGKVVHVDRLVKCTEEEQHFSLQIAEDLYQIPDGSKRRELPDFVNHGCAPTCGLLDATTLVALRDLQPGDEITYDYAMSTANSMANTCDNFKCECGAVRCRGLVAADDWRLPELWERYEGHFSPYIKRKIDALRREQDGPEVDGKKAKLVRAHTLALGMVDRGCPGAFTEYRRTGSISSSSDSMDSSEDEHAHVISEPLELPA